MKKIEKERRFKTEYIPVYICSVILVLFICLIVLTINYEGKKSTNSLATPSNAVNEDLAITKTDSKCNQDELNELLNLANKVSGDYQAANKKVPIEKTEENIDYYEDLGGMVTYRYIEIIIKGIKEGIYAQITNNYNDDIITIRPSDLNEAGEYKYEAPTMDKVVTYTVNIYAEKYGCTGEIIRKVSFDTKIYNTKSDLLACIMYPNYDGCVKLVDKEISITDFYNDLEKYKKNVDKAEAVANANILNAFAQSEVFTADDLTNENGNNKKNTEYGKVINKLKDNLDLIVIAFSSIGIAVLVIILIMFVRRHKL